MDTKPYEVTEYYTVDAYFKKRYKSIGRNMGLKAKNLEEYYIWKNEARAKLKQAIGLNTMLTCSLNPVLKESITMDGYTREKYIIQTEPEIYMPFYILIPDKVKKGEKGIPAIAPHGHGSAGKVSVAGRYDLNGIGGSIKRYNGDYGIQLVKAGFTVFCPDARGFGERRQPHLQGSESGIYLDNECSACTVINRMAIPLGQTVIGMWVWDLMRLVDYISTREDCNAEKIACAGLSGGGMQTLWLTALDDRVKACIVSGYFYGFEEALLEMNNCSCNYAPHVWECVDAGDIGALIAPKDFIIETGTEDRLNGKSGLANVIPQFEIVREAYKLFNAENKLVHDVFKGDHMWHGTVSIPRLKEVLGVVD